MNALKLQNARLGGTEAPLVDLYVEQGRFVKRLQTGTWDTLDLQGRLVLPGLVETHIHLDKACIMSRCALREGTLAEAIAETRAAKADFTEEDIYARGAKVLEKAMLHGTTHMRTHVEIDPGIGLTGFHAIRRLQRDYAWAITLEICVFPQEGLLDNPGTEELLREALDAGAEVLGGCPYTDRDAAAQIRRLFEIAREYDRDLDFHLDFDLNPEGMTVQEVARCTVAHGWQERVTIGHVTKLSAVPRTELEAIGRLLADAGVRVTALPSTDLFLTGREHFHNKPRGVAPLDALHRCGVVCSLSSNNLGNPFTPYGDASLIRQANLFANVAQLATSAELLRCLAWVSCESARLLRLPDYGLTPGCQADFVVFDAPSADAVVAEVIPPRMGFKRGRQVFERPLERLLRP